ncbi:MAG: bifunctional diguanylate cyclase/phosphodiesterase [Telluria sp.]
MENRLVVAARAGAHALRRASAALLQFLKEHRWRLLAGPLVVLVGCLLAWGILLSELGNKRRAIEAEALHDARAWSAAYADQIMLGVEGVEQAARYVQYEWAITEGKLHLGYADEDGLFLHRLQLLACVVDPQGRVTTATRPAPVSAQAIRTVLERTRNGVPVYFMPDQISVNGEPVHRLLFAWPLTDKDGSFAAAVVIAVDPAFFTRGYNQAIYKPNGLLAVLGDDGVTLALRSEDDSPTPRQPDFLHAQRPPSAPGSALVGGKAWFQDGRDRIVGWRHLIRGDASALVALDYQTVLAPYRDVRMAWIRSATVATVTLAALTFLLSLYSMRLARKKQELELINQTYRMATEASNEGFYMLRPVRGAGGGITDFEVIDCNRRGAELVGRTQQDLTGALVSGLYAGPMLEERMRQLCSAMETGYEEITLERPHPGSPARWVHMKLVRHGDNLAVSARDISAERNHADELVRRSTHDPLTGLPNRYWVEAYLVQAVERASAGQTRFALLFVDLDGFKAINDTWGHAAGDELLRAAASRLTEAVRPQDRVTRFRGDEFVIVLEEIEGAYDAAQVSERILRAFSRSIQLSYGEYVIGASIGISMYPADGAEARTLLHNADIAMYSVKTSGRGGYRFFDVKFHDQLKHRLELVLELRQALARDQFIIYYQPRARLSDGAVSSMEALVRWVHPTRGLVSPNEFIPVVEESGLVLQLGELVIDKVCAQLAQWQKQGVELVPVSVNVSPRQFNHTDVVRTLSLALERHQVSPALLEVEVTESSVANPTVALPAVQAIQRSGIKVLLDDFGTGYSSLSQLYALNLDGLKIDRAFVLQLGKRPGGAAIVTAIVTMARALGMHVVAEGVETREQVDILKALGCDEIQGYLVSRPVPPAETQALVSDFVLTA